MHTYDMYYLRNRTMLLDLYILLATVWVVLFRFGAR
jgi:lipopolysaccharide/colanic/teichoic acid biosynthesis glycosyltransferase